MSTEYERRRKTTKNKLKVAGVPEQCLRTERHILVGRDFSRSKEREWVGTSFVGDDLEGACFDGVDLERADFSGANLKNASFQGAKLTLTIFTDATCIGADFTDAEMWFTDFKGTKLQKATITPQQLAHSQSDELTEFDPELWGK
jgi:uncharacterized protein YjbI with pentapeptide repeats